MIMIYTSYQVWQPKQSAVSTLSYNCLAGDFSGWLRLVPLCLGTEFYCGPSLHFRLSAHLLGCWFMTPGTPVLPICFSFICVTFSLVSLRGSLLLMSVPSSTMPVLSKWWVLLDLGMLKVAKPSVVGWRFSWDSPDPFIFSCFDVNK